MELAVIEQVSAGIKSERKATMADVAAYLAELGMVAVPLDPTGAMRSAAWEHTCVAADKDEFDDVYRAMIKAAGEQA